MSMLSEVEAEIKRVYGSNYNAAEDFPVEVKIMIGVFEKQVNQINARIAALESRRPVPVVTAPTAQG